MLDDLQEVLIRVTKVAGSGALTMSFGLLFQDDSLGADFRSPFRRSNVELWQLWVRLQACRLKPMLVRWLPSRRTRVE
jgi:hypothetical protein